MNREEEIEQAASEYSQNYDCFGNVFDIETGFVKGAKWADKHPANLWHSVKDGDLPPFNKVCLFNCNGTTYIGFIRGDKSLYLKNYLYLSLSINDINHWMEIPKLPND